MSSSEENKAVVRACFENASRGNFDALDEIVTEDYVLHPEEAHGADGLKQMVQGCRDALGGLRVTIDQQLTEGDYVATRFTIHGTHDGELMGTPPTGKEVAPRGSPSGRPRASCARSARERALPRQAARPDERRRSFSRKAGRSAARCATRPRTPWFRPLERGCRARRECAFRGPSGR